MLPFDGLRVVDLTMVWAGPFATKLLADMGAEVIKVEGPRRLDPLRMAVAEIFMQGDVDWSTQPYNRSAYFNEYSRNKKSLTLALDTPEGRDILLHLISKSDIIIENFRPDAMAKLGLDHAAIATANPDIVSISMPAYGATGPDSGLVGYGPSIEEMTGLAHLNGYRDGPPTKSGISWGDPMAGVLAAAAAALAILDHPHHGGQHVEVAQRDGLVGVVGDALLSWQLTDTEPERLGNRDHVWAPQGCYPCLPFPSEEARPLDIYHRAGQDERVADRWVAVTVDSDRAWSALCGVIGRPDLAEDAELATPSGRHARHDELDAALAAWTSKRGDYEAADALQQAGIAASPVVSMTCLSTDPHLSARGFFERVQHPAAGPTLVCGTNWRMVESSAPSVRHPAPLFGQHNTEILQGLLGIDEAEIDRLKQKGVIADEPIF